MREGDCASLGNSLSTWKPRPPCRGFHLQSAYRDPTPFRAVECISIAGGLALEVRACPCRGGEIGRRKGLKIPRSKGHAGSIPALGTIVLNKLERYWRMYVRLCSRSVFPVFARHTVQELAGVLVPGVGEDVGGGAALDDLAVAHHKYVVADVGSDSQIVGDKQHRQA